MGASQLNKNPVSTLLRTAVKEIGLRSESIDWGRFILPQRGDASFIDRRIEDRTYRVAYTWCKVLQRPVRDFVGTNWLARLNRRQRKINGFRTDDVFVWDVRYGNKGEMQSRNVISNLTTVPLIKFIKFNLAEGLINCFSEGLVPENWPIHCHTRQGGGGALKDQTTIWYCPTTFWG